MKEILLKHVNRLSKDKIRIKMNGFNKKIIRLNTLRRDAFDFKLNLTQEQLDHIEELQEFYNHQWCNLANYLWWKESNGTRAYYWNNWEDGGAVVLTENNTLEDLKNYKIKKNTVKKSFKNKIVSLFKS